MVVPFDMSVMLCRCPLWVLNMGTALVRRLPVFGGNGRQRSPLGVFCDNQGLGMAINMSARRLIASNWLRSGTTISWQTMVA